MKELTFRNIQSIAIKNRIVECADKLFTNMEYEDVKIKDICKSAGVSVGGFYHYFGSKEDIINEAYRAFDIRTEELMQSKIFNTRCEAILFLMDYQLNAISSKGYIYTTCYFKNQLSNKEKYILSKERYFYKQLLVEVAEAINNGEIYYEDAEKLTDLLIRISRGAVYDWCLYEGSYNVVEQTIEDMKSILGAFSK